MSLGLPNINIQFQELANTAIQRGTKGIVALVLVDATAGAPTGFINIQTNSDIPSKITGANTTQINFALLGKPSMVKAYFIAATPTDSYAAVMKALEAEHWNYLAIPGIDAVNEALIVTWVQGLRDTKDIRVKAVLPNAVADHEGIISIVTDNIIEGATTYHATDCCSRIAGLLAGLPLGSSSTYSVLKEVTDVTHLSIADANTAIGNGGLLLINDTEKVKIARGVNSYHSIQTGKGDEFRKILLVDIMDQIHDDLKMATANNYIGKVPNTYDNKILLISSIKEYFEGLENQGILTQGENTIDIDIAAQTAYLKSINYTNSDGKDVTKMTNQEIKEANTGDKVFLTASIKMVDAIEDVALNISL